ncbi:MAG TPA: VWA domain-containing protein [Terriglobales bacterium]|jgi:VWFA-related protein|nr:VWA domain-containing protein [Terriglobales bacterium]
MYSEKHLKSPDISPKPPSLFGAALAALVAVSLLWPVSGAAQSSGGDQGSPQAQSQQKQNQDDQVPAAAGGPTGESGPIVVPKRGNTEAPPPPPKPKPTDIPQYSLHVDVPVVTVDAQIMQKNGRPIELPLEQAKEHFKVFEDGVPQRIQSVTKSKAPITAVLLVEFAATDYHFMYDALNSSYIFASQLQPQDWVAVAEFDVKSHILIDFTQDKQAIFGALNSLRVPGFSETDIYDAIFDMLDRLDRVPGRKELVVVASGRDTFSKLTLDQTLKKIKATPNVTIYTICTGKAFLDWAQARGGANPDVTSSLMDYVQAENQMNAFARMTGGRSYAPQMMGELPDIFREVAGAIRDQYTITYKPTNTKQDGTYRKVKVELVGPDDKPLIIKDEKNKDIKYTILARDGYTAKHEVE